MKGTVAAMSATDTTPERNPNHKIVLFMQAA